MSTDWTPFGSVTMNNIPTNRFSRSVFEIGEHCAICSVV